jgi:hypothetical protein
MAREGWLFERGLLNFSWKISRLRLSEADKDVVDSSKRKFKSKTGVPMINKTTWSKTILDVRAENAEVYCEEITAWSRSVLEEAEAIEIG